MPRTPVNRDSTTVLRGALSAANWTWVEQQAKAQHATPSDVVTALLQDWAQLFGHELGLRRLLIEDAENRGLTLPPLPEGATGEVNLRSLVLECLRERYDTLLLESTGRGPPEVPAPAVGPARPQHSLSVRVPVSLKVWAESLARHPFYASFAAVTDQAATDRRLLYLDATPGLPGLTPEHVRVLLADASTGGRDTRAYLKWLLFQRYVRLLRSSKDSSSSPPAGSLPRKKPR